MQHLVEKESEKKLEQATHEKTHPLLLVGISARCHGYKIRFKVRVDVEKTPIVEEHWRLTASSNG